MDGAVGSEGAEGIGSRLHLLLRYKTGCIQDAALWPAFSLQARQWNGNGNIENVLAYSTAHELSRAPFLPKPWQLEGRRPGTIKASDSLSFLSKSIGSPHHAKPSVLGSLRS